ncbi:MAG: hypothetical protein SNF33_03485 [Candidatus Algichlamydia australiensis]|nr:hypothetical protein [Chlamydiales bacterium]
MNGVVHFEIPLEDLEKGKEFYKIFGWEMGYYAYIADPDENILGLWEAKGAC